MDKLEMESKIVELGQKIINLREMIATSQQALSEDEEAISKLMAELDIDEVKDALEEVRVFREVTKIVKFDSKGFKKANPKMYEDYRIESKTFSRKLLKTNKPELYNEFVSEGEVSHLTIERYYDEGSLPSI